jgi:hypothetical protein
MQQNPTKTIPIIPLTSNFERIIFEEAQLLARERYDSNVSHALNILYRKFRNIGDKPSASIAYELLQRFEDIADDE